MVRLGKTSSVSAFIALLLAFQVLSAAQMCFANPGVTVNLSQTSGPIGITVTVSGQLENPGAEFKIFWHYIKDWDGRYGFLVSGYAEGYNYTANIIIPPAAKGDYYVIVEDEKNHATGYAIFTVTPEISVQPDTAPSGAIVSVSGKLINGERIDIKFYDPASGDEVLVAQAVTDSITGELTSSFRVPLKPEGDYVVRAYWSGALQAEAPLHIGYQGMFVKPDKAPPGATVNVYGGLAVNETLILAFQNSTWSVDVATFQTDGSGQFSVNVAVPQASPGDYAITALDPVGRTEFASVPFTILPPAQITVASDAINPNEALPGFSKVTVHGENFIANEPVAIYFESAPVKVAETTVEPDGTFSAVFTVPADASAGTHTILAVQDPYNVSASATITVHSVAIMPYAMLNYPESVVLYVPGDTIAFHINSTTPFAVPSEIAVNIYDPSGIPYALQGLHVNTAYDVVQVNGFYVVPYDRTAFWPEIPRGAPAGMWTWNATSYLQLYPGVQFNASGIFGVMPEPDLNYILQRLNQIEAKIEGVAYKQDQLYLLIQANHNYVMARLDQLEANLISVTQSGLAEINTVLGVVQVKLDLLDAKVTSVEDDVAIIQTSLGTLTADVSELKSMLAQVGASIVEVKDGVATIQAGVGEIKADLAALNATLVDIGNGVAFVQTAVGTLSAGLDVLNASVASVWNGTAALNTAIGELKVSLADLQANITQLIVDAKGEVIVQMQTLLGPVNATLEDLGGKITAIDGNMANVIIPGIGQLQVAVASAQHASENASQAVSGMNTVMYAVLAVSIAAAAISAFNLLHVRRKEAAS